MTKGPIRCVPCCLVHCGEARGCVRSPWRASPPSSRVLVVRLAAPALGTQAPTQGQGARAQPVEAADRQLLVAGGPALGEGLREMPRRRALQRARAVQPAREARCPTQGSPTIAVRSAGSRTTSATGPGWFVESFARKAGARPATAAHCTNRVEDADEFGVDCGGNECAACTAWARAQFAKAIWLTEFAPSTADAGSAQTMQQRIARALAYVASELPILEASGAVFRYAWFMPKTNIGSLDHVDLLTETTPVLRTEVGRAYLNHPH